MNSTGNSPNQLQNKQLSKKADNDFAICLAKILQKYSELEQIVKVWPCLPEHIKTVIKTLAGITPKPEGK